METLLALLFIFIGFPAILILFFYFCESLAFVSIFSTLKQKWNNSMENDGLVRMLYKPPRTDAEKMKYLAYAVSLLCLGLIPILFLIHSILNIRVETISSEEVYTGAAVIGKGKSFAALFTMYETATLLLAFRIFRIIFQKRSYEWLGKDNDKVS